MSNVRIVVHEELERIWKKRYDLFEDNILAYIWREWENLRHHSLFPVRGLSLDYVKATQVLRFLQRVVQVEGIEVNVKMRRKK
jgi:hypothetical protein